MYKPSGLILALVVLNFAIKSVGGWQHFWVTNAPREQKAVVNLVVGEEGNPYPLSSPAHRELQEFNDWISHNKKLQAASSGTSRTDGVKLIGQLGSKGMARLPTDLLEGYIPILEKVINSFDNTACGNFLRGKMSLSDGTPYVYPVIGSLDDADAKKFFSVLESAIDAQLNNLPIVPMSKADVRAGVIKISASMRPDEAQSFLVSVGNLRTESDANACQTVRTLFSRRQLLSEPYRSAVTRMLLGGRPGGLTRRYEDLPPQD